MTLCRLATVKKANRPAKHGRIQGAINTAGAFTKATRIMAKATDTFTLTALAALAGSYVLPASAGAQQAAEDGHFLNGRFSGGLALTSDRIWRGVSQTMGEPAAIGEVIWTHSSRLSVGVWVSNLDLGVEYDTEAEVDYFIGYSRRTGRLGVNLGHLYRSRPSDSANLSFNETTVSLDYDFGGPSVRSAFYHSTDYFLGGRSNYLSAGASVPLGSLAGLTLILSADAGRYSFTRADIGDYSDWRLRIHTRVRPNVGMSLAYSSTNIDVKRSRVPGHAQAEDRVAATIVWMF